MCVCDVPEPEERFNMDEFSELLIVNKPVIYISVSELLNTHKVCADLNPVPDPDPTGSVSLAAVSLCLCLCVSVSSCCWSTRRCCVPTRLIPSGCF